MLDNFARVLEGLSQIVKLHGFSSFPPFSFTEKSEAVEEGVDAASSGMYTICIF